MGDPSGDEGPWGRRPRSGSPSPLRTKRTRAARASSSAGIDGGPWELEDPDHDGPWGVPSAQPRRRKKIVQASSEDAGPWLPPAERPRRPGVQESSGDIGPWEAAIADTPEAKPKASRPAVNLQAGTAALSMASSLASARGRSGQHAYQRNGSDPARVKDRLMAQGCCRCGMSRLQAADSCHRLVPLHTLTEICQSYWSMSDEERAFMVPWAGGGAGARSWCVGACRGPIHA